MTPTELRKLIREETKRAVEEAIKDILVEAVVIASTPTLEEIKKPVKTEKPSKPQPPLDPIARLLEETRQGMSRKEYQEIISGNEPLFSETSKPLPTGTRPEDIGSVDLSMIPGIGKAALILKEAQKKDKERLS